MTKKTNCVHCGSDKTFSATYFKGSFTLKCKDCRRGVTLSQMGNLSLAADVAVAIYNHTSEFDFKGSGVIDYRSFKGDVAILNNKQE